MDQLNAEILYCIFELLPATALASLRLTSRTFLPIATDILLAYSPSFMVEIQSEDEEGIEDMMAQMKAEAIEYETMDRYDMEEAPSGEWYSDGGFTDDGFSGGDFTDEAISEGGFTEEAISEEENSEEAFFDEEVTGYEGFEREDVVDTQKLTRRSEKGHANSSNTLEAEDSEKDASLASKAGDGEQAKVTDRKRERIEYEAQGTSTGGRRQRRRIFEVPIRK